MINLYEEQIQDTAIDLYAEPETTLPPDIVEQRTQKADYALGELSPGPDSIRASIASGNEKFMREHAAKQRDLQIRGVKNEMLQEYIKAKDGQPVSNEEADFLLGLTYEQLTDPKYVIERELARKVISQSQELSDDDVDEILNDEGLDDIYNAREGTLSAEAFDDFDKAEGTLARNQMVITRLEELQAQADKRSGGAKVWDFAEQMVPFLWWWQTQNAVDTTVPLTGFLPGSNWEQQSTYLHMLPPEKFGPAFNEAIDDIAARNVDMALLTDIADVALEAGAVGVAGKIGRKLLGKGLRDTVTAASELKIDSANVLATTGDTVTAGAMQAVKGVKSKILQSDIDFRGTQVWNAVPSIVNPRQITRRAISLAGAPAQRIQEALIQSSGLLQTALTRPGMAARMSQSTESASVQKTMDRLRTDFSDFNSSILNIAHATKHKTNLGNVHTVEMMLGRPDGSLFTSRKQAESYAQKIFKLPLGGYNIVPQGKRFFLSVLKDVDETDGDALSLTLDTENTAPTSWQSLFFGRVRTPEDLVSSLSRDNRHAVTHSTQEFRRYVKEVAEGVGRLGSKDRDSLEGFLNANRDWKSQKKDPKTGEVYTKMGRWFSDLAEFEKAWLKYKGAPPTEAVAEAYFKFKQLNDFDYVIRNLGYYRDLARQGAEEHAIVLDGKPTPFFQAKEVQSIPRLEDVSDDAGILVIDPDSKMMEVKRKNTSRDEVMKLVKDKGMKILQVVNPVERPFQAWTKQPVMFVVTKDTQHRPLQFQQFDYNDGGHVAYTQEWYLKQAVITKHSETIPNTKGKFQGLVVAHRLPDGTTYVGKPGELHFDLAEKHPSNGRGMFDQGFMTPDGKYLSREEALKWVEKRQQKIKAHPDPLMGGKLNWLDADDYNTQVPQQYSPQRRFWQNYEGDRAFAVFTTEAEAKKYVGLVNQGRLLLKKPAALKKFLQTNLPMYDRKDFLRLFKAHRDKDGNVIPPKFDPEEPIHVAFRNDTVEDTLRNTDQALNKRYPGLMSVSSSPFNLMRNVSKEFTGPRDLDLTTFKETATGLKMMAAKKIDSFEMMSKAVTGLTNDRFFKDYQYQAVTSWLKQFGNALTPEGFEAARRSPLDAILRPQYDNGTGKAVLVEHAKQNQKAVVEFLNKQSNLDQALHMTLHKVLSSVYNLKGQEWSDALSGWNILKIDEPFRRTRAFAFHLNLGLFNPVQIFTQSQTLAHATAILPQHALKSLPAAYLLRMAKYGPDHLQHYAKMATKFGWTKEEFTDMYEHMMASGWGNVEGEVGYLDDISNPGLWDSTGKKWLDKGKFFFNGTERFNRLYGFALAYRELRSMHPGQVINDRMRASLLTRADDLTLNMTRASNTMLQRGIFSLPLQFFTYQQRMMEQMLGKRLTVPEKARIVAVYSTLYGVPIGAASSILPWPFYDDVRQSAMEKGLEVNEGWRELLLEGVPSLLLEAVFGTETNYGDRYGPSGLNILKDVIGQDKTFMDIAFGVSGTTIEETWQAMHPMIMGLTSVFREDNTHYPLMIQDFLDIGTKNIKSLNNFRQMYSMLNTGKYISKNGLSIADVDVWDAVFRGFTGLSPREVSDTFLMIGSMKDLDAHQRDARNRVVADFQKGFKALQERRTEDADMHFKRAKAEMILGGFLPTQYGQLLQDSLRGMNLDLHEDILIEFYLKNAPASEAKARQKKFLKDMKKGQ
jgi:hypothetical protein